MEEKKSVVVLNLILKFQKLRSARQAHTSHQGVIVTKNEIKILGFVSFNCCVLF